jgi:hypothetical protein
MKHARVSLFPLSNHLRIKRDDVPPRTRKKLRGEREILYRLSVIAVVFLRRETKSRERERDEEEREDEEGSGKSRHIKVFVLIFEEEKNKNFSSFFEKKFFKKQRLPGDDVKKNLKIHMTVAA